MAYGARLESVLGASPRGFESPILRHQSGTVRFRIFLCLIYSRFSRSALLPRSPLTPGPAFSRRRRPTHSLPPPITQRPATSEIKIPPRIAWRELVAVAPGFEPGVACTTQHFECCTFGRSDTLPRLLNLPEITANTQTLLTQPQSHRKCTPQTRHAGSDSGQGDVGP